VGWSGSADADLARAVRWNDGEIVALTEPVVIAALDPFAFVPTEVTVTPGQEVIVVNTGLSQHDLVVDEWSIATDLLEGGGQAFFTIPDDAEVGTVVPFYCPVPGHRENGMEGTFAIVEGGAAAPVEEGAESTPADAGAVPAEPIVLEAQDPFQWSSNDISAAPGQVIEVTNAGLLEHDFVVDELGISEPLPAGEVVEVTIPADAPVGDTYVFYCSIPGHRESGMEGALTIIEPSQVSSQTSNASLTEEALTGLLPASDQMPNNLTDTPDSGRDRDPPAARSGRPRVSHGR
jgi:plastocyanin